MVISGISTTSLYENLPCVCAYECVEHVYIYFLVSTNSYAMQKLYTI